MDAQNIKARLAAVDAQIADKLRGLGFTEDEIQRQLDNSIPSDVRKAEAEAILARKFATDLNDPQSGLMDQIIAQVVANAPQIEKQLAAERAARRRKVLLGAGIAVIGAAIVLYLTVLRPASVTMCEQLATPVDEIGAILGKPLGAGTVVGEPDYCTLVLGADRESVVTIIVQSSRRFPEVRKIRDGQPFSRFDSVKVATGDALLYIEGQPAADASGRNEILLEAGAKMVEIDLARGTTPAQMTALATLFANRTQSTK